jgi:hypothetical protein
MKTLGEYLGRNIVRAISVAALAAVASVGLSAPSASAAQVWDRGRDVRVDRNDIQRVAFINGYSDGYEQGVRDRSRRSRYYYQGADRYRSGRTGYNNDWRLEREYQGWYRQGFQRGYSDGFYGRSRNRDYDRGRWNNNRYPYNNYPGYGNGGYYDNREGDKDRDDVARIAAENGYRAGFERGQYDAAQRNHANPQGHGAYQFGFDGFDPNWGSASTYQQYYRSYFVRGYQDGYNRRSYNRDYRRF